MIILYLILLGGLFLFYMLYSDDLSLIILITAMITPVLLFIQLVYTGRRIKVTAENEAVRVRKGEKTAMDILLTNPTVFPMPLAKMKIRCVMRPTGETQIKTVTVPLPAKSTRKLSITLYSEYCRRIEFDAARIRFYDLLHLFSIERKCGLYSVSTVDFIPSGDYEMDSVSAEKLGLPFYSQSGALAAVKNINLSEYDELRTYRNGDKPSRIAWKLSGRDGSDEILVRDSGSLSAPSILLAADTASAKIRTSCAA